MAERTEGRHVQSVVKALALLDCLAQQRRPMALGELAQAVDLPKATAHGLLASLRLGGAVEQSGVDGKYRLGVRLFEYGCAVSASWDVVSRSREQMNHIAIQTGSNVILSSLQEQEAIVLEMVEATGAFRVVSEKGSRVPLHCTSKGKLLLAYLPAGEQRRLLGALDFTAYTPHTISDRERLELELEHIRRQGYAVEDGEYRVGLRSVAAPIFSVEGQVRWAIGIVGMFRRVSSEEFQQARELVCRAAERISYDMGYRRETQ